MCICVKGCAILSKCLVMGKSVDRNNLGDISLLGIKGERLKDPFLQLHFPNSVV